MDNEQFIKCPCCGGTTLAAPVKMDEAAKLHYIACMVSGVPYSKEYELFEGKLKITVSQLTPQQQDKCLRIGARITLSADQKYREVLSDIITRVYKLLPIVKIQVSQDDGQAKVFPVQIQLGELMAKTLTASTTEELHEIYTKLVDPAVMTAVSPVILDKVVQTHNLTIDMLIASGFDEGFSQGIPQSC